VRKLVVTYLLGLGITFVFYPDGIGVAYRNDLSEHVTVVFPQREAETSLDIDQRVITVFSSSGEVNMVNDAEFRRFFPSAHQKDPDWIILPNMGINERGMK
jgi:hypothetical protein